MANAKRAKVEGRGALIIIALIAAIIFGQPVYYASHIGAPPLDMHCPPNDYQKTWWVPESNPYGKGDSGTLDYHGWRELGGCATDLKIRVRTGG